MTLKIALGVFIGVVIIIIGFVLFIPHTNQGEPLEDELPAETPALPDFTFKHSWSRGVHTIQGVVKAPTPCTSVTASSTITMASSTPAHITVDLTMPPSTGICLQVITDMPFKVTADAKDDATLGIVINGVLATTTPAL